MNGLLVRVGIDSTDGGWNASVRTVSGEFAPDAEAKVPDLPQGRDSRRLQPPPARKGVLNGFEPMVKALGFGLSWNWPGPSGVGYGSETARTIIVGNLGPDHFPAFRFDVVSRAVAVLPNPFADPGPALRPLRQFV